MDPEGILAIIFIFGGGTLFLLAVSPVGKALADRIRHGAHPAGSGSADPEVLAELDQLRQDVTELQERMDFSERLLAQKKSSGDLPAGDQRPRSSRCKWQFRHPHPPRRTSIRESWVSAPMRPSS